VEAEERAAAAAAADSRNRLFSLSVLGNEGMTRQSASLRALARSTSLLEHVIRKSHLARYAAPPYNLHLLINPFRRRFALDFPPRPPHPNFHCRSSSSGAWHVVGVRTLALSHLQTALISNCLFAPLFGSVKTENEHVVAPLPKIWHMWCLCGDRSGQKTANVGNTQWTRRLTHRDEPQVKSHRM
jgi:hypothetical protein